MHDGKQMEYHTIKWREMRSKNNSIEHIKESTIVNFIKLIFKEHTMKFLIGLQLLHPPLTTESNGTPSQFVRQEGAKQKFNFAVLLSFNRFPFV
jgi:hypothetical protein